MDFTIKNVSPDKLLADCIIVGVFEQCRQSQAAATLDVVGGKKITALLECGDFTGKVGESMIIHDLPKIAASRVVLIGCGRKKSLDSVGYVQIIRSGIEVVLSMNVKHAAFCIAQIDVIQRDTHWKFKRGVEIADHVHYQFNQFKSKKRSLHKLRKLSFDAPPTASDLATARRAVKAGAAIAEGVSVTRDLANLPANVCTPSYLANHAKSLAKTDQAFKVKVLHEAAMRDLGMEVLLSVSQGSRQSAKLIIMEYRGGKKSSRPYALVGKGVTFDTGGISIKPAAAMDEMKYDMCGAASVLGTLVAVAKMALPINVVGIIPAVENMPGGAATRPGDIYTSLSGQTVEILNTDAEGRLILCDALTYAERFNPETVIDIATLTGACVVALGKHAAGLLSNDDPLASNLLKAGEMAGDRAWRLPLWDEYQSQINSPFADVANIGGREAGTITAACFLSRFTRSFRWAHLDIAGTAWISGKGRNKGATGRPVPLLTQYLMDRC